jgi:hypothetical protein
MNVAVMTYMMDGRQNTTIVMTNTLPDNLYLTDKHKVYENKICSSGNFHSGAYASIVILIQDSYFVLSEFNLVTKTITNQTKHVGIILALGFVTTFKIIHYFFASCQFIVLFKCNLNLYYSSQYLLGLTINSGVQNTNCYQINSPDYVISFWTYESPHITHILVCS